MLSFNFEKIVRRSNRIKRASTLKGFSKKLSNRKATIYVVGLLLLAGVALGGFKLGTFAADRQPIDVGYNFNYQGVSVHTKAENIAPVSARNNTATAKAGDTVKFTLTVNNPESLAKSTDVKFSTPTGFKYSGMKAGSDGTTASAPTTGGCATAIVTGYSGDMIWCNYSAKSGDSFIVLDTLAP
mgnify:CR=1 FL=1